MIKVNTQIKGKEPKKLLPLTCDVIFKAVFSSPENEDVLKALLEAILGIKIKKVVVQNPELPIDFSDSKAGVMDLKATIDDNTVCGIEMQVKNLGDIDNRSAYYLSKTLASEVKRGTNYSQVKKAISINFLDFEFYKRNSYRSIAHMKFEKTKENEFVDLGYAQEEEIATKNLEMHFIELPKFRKNLHKPKTKLEQWLCLMVGRSDLMEGLEERVKEIEKAEETLRKLSMDKQAWYLYEARDMAKMDYNTGMRNAEERGIKRGEKIGIKKGEQRGEKRGAQKSKLEVAKKMLMKKVPILDIIEFTGLSKEDLAEIK